MRGSSRCLGLGSGSGLESGSVSCSVGVLVLDLALEPGFGPFTPWAASESALTPNAGSATKSDLATNWGSDHGVGPTALSHKHGGGMDGKDICTTFTLYGCGTVVVQLLISTAFSVFFPMFQMETNKNKRNQ